MLSNIIIIAIIVERVWEHLQLLIGAELLSARLKLLGSVIFSVLATILFELDMLFALELFPAVSWPGIILTGFVVSLGSNVIHDLVGLIKGFREDYRPLNVDASMLGKWGK